MTEHAKQTSDNNNDNTDTDTLAYEVLLGFGPLKRIYDDEILCDLMANARFSELIGSICRFIDATCQRRVLEKCEDNGDDEAYALKEGDAERVVEYYDVSLFHVSKNMEIIAEELAERFEKKHEKDIERIAHIDISKQK